MPQKPLRTLLTALLFCIPQTKATPTPDSKTTQATSLHDNSQNCTCYTLDSGTGDQPPPFFLYHKFYDFRALPASSSEPPPVVTETQRFGTELALDQSVLNSSAWNHDWEIQTWGKKSGNDAPVAMQNSAQNVFIGKHVLLSAVSLAAGTYLVCWFVCSFVRCV